MVQTNSEIDDPAFPDASAGANTTTVLDKTHRIGSWPRFLLAKAGGALVSLIMVVILGFFAFRVLPGDPVRAMAQDRRVTPEQLEALRVEFGLDQPLLVQFWNYLIDLTTGNLGHSYTHSRPVSELILDHLVPTLLLTGTAAALAVVVGLWIGQRAAWKRGQLYDQMNMGVALTLWSVPTFWLGLILLMVFGGTLHWFPTGGMETTGAGYTGIRYALDVAHHLVLPALSMGAVSYAHYLLVMRASLLEVMHEDYLQTARAIGLRESLVRKRHAIPNALLPTVTIVFLTVGGLISGAVTVETVFSWPGLGYLTYQALGAPDFPLLQGTFVVFSVIVIISNLLADVAYRILDPRLRTA